MNNLVYLFAVIIVALGLYSLELKRTNTALEQTIHGHYMNDLASASQSLQQLESEVTQSLLFQDERALHTSLDTIWRLSSDLKTSIAELPLPADVANGWMNYVGKIGDRAKVAAQGDASEWKQSMPQVRANLKNLNEEWATATASLFSRDGQYKKWLEAALDESPQSVFAANSKALQTYSETDFPLTASESDYAKKRDLQHLMDQQLTKDEVTSKFKQLFPDFEKATMYVTKSENDAAYPFYHLQFNRGTRIGYADFTEKGGHLLSLLIERPFTDRIQTHDQIRASAEEFLKRAGYEDVQYVESRENENVWHLVYSRFDTKHNAVVYPDSIQLKVAKDDGEVLGVNAMEYVQKEQLPDVTPVPLDPQSFFAPSTVVEQERLIYTEDDKKVLSLCYELIVRQPDMDRSTYRVVIDSVSHALVHVELLP